LGNNTKKIISSKNYTQGAFLDDEINDYQNKTQNKEIDDELKKIINIDDDEDKEISQSLTNEIQKSLNSVQKTKIMLQNAKILEKKDEDDIKNIKQNIIATNSSYVHEDENDDVEEIENNEEKEEKKNEEKKILVVIKGKDEEFKINFKTVNNIYKILE
jgi:hypothetical protein